MAGLSYIREMADCAVNAALGVITVPNPLLSELDLAECYAGLHTFLDNVYTGSNLHKSHARRDWGILEFQSSWHVLSTVYGKAYIGGFSEQDRLAEYESFLEQRKVDLFPNLHRERTNTKNKLETLLLITEQPLIAAEPQVRLLPENI